MADGSCKGNHQTTQTRQGGSAAILECSGVRKEPQGTEDGMTVTNNRMELTAVLRGFQALKQPCEVHLVLGSRYVMDGWLKKNFKKVKNDDLWRALHAAMQGHCVTSEWVKGHAAHSGNNRADALATGAATAHLATPITAVDWDNRKRLTT